jgi:intracellular septation protein
MRPGIKLLVEAGPLIAFFIANWKGGIFWGTGVFMVAITIALAASWIMTRKLAMVPLIGAVFVAIFGALTLWLHDDTFIKIKVTLINGLFGAILLGGLLFGQTFLKYVMGEAIKMTDQGWRTLTLRWGIFFFALAAINEFVWRTLTTESWVNFKVFGLMPLTIVFALSQGPFMAKHMIEDKPETP